MRTVVLVVDDHRDTAEMLACLLLTRGIDAITAACVREAKAVLASRSVDLVLTDYCMPGEDGLSLVRFCARTRPALPVVVMTGWGRLQVELAALEAGAFDLLEKPFTMEDLDRVCASARTAAAVPVQSDSACHGLSLADHNA